MGTRTTAAKQRGPAKALQASRPATKRTPSKAKQYGADGLTQRCREIRDLALAMPRIHETEDPRDPDDLRDTTATREQHRAYRRVNAMQDKFGRLVGRLLSQRTHTMPELATLVLASSYALYMNGVGLGSKGNELSCLMPALLRTLCGVEPADIEAAWGWAAAKAA